MKCPVSSVHALADQPLRCHVLHACRRQWQARRKNGTCTELGG